MLAVVTGASGFIGANLTRKLVLLGFRVRVILRASSRARHLSDLPLERVHVDFEDAHELSAATRDAEWVFHLAGSVAECDARRFDACNLGITRRLAQACAGNAARPARFIYVSSLAAAGPALGPSSPKTESDSDEPVSEYGRSKLRAERALEALSSELPVTVVRPPAVYGPRDAGILEFFRMAKLGILPQLPSDQGRPTEKYYSLIHVDDLSEGILSCATRPGSNVFERYYLTGDEAPSLTRIMETLASLMSRRLTRVRIPWLALRSAARMQEWVTRWTGGVPRLNSDKLNELLPNYWICSADKAKKELGFCPTRDLEGGLRETLAWYRSNGWL